MLTKIIRSLFGKYLFSQKPMPFIVGVDRSGTTLLRLMLDAHPALAIPGETHFIPDLAAIKETGSDELRELFINKMTSSPFWPQIKVPPDILKERLGRVDPFTISDGLRCFYRTYSDRFGKKRWGDKTPIYLLHMVEIQKLLPEARFIHIIRDGRDVALSLKKAWWIKNKEMGSLAEFWTSRIIEGRRQAQITGNYMEVRYENLILNPAKVLKDICTFIELDYDERMLRYHEIAGRRLDELSDLDLGTYKATKEERIKRNELLFRPPDTSRIGAYRTNMDEYDRRKFESVAKGMLIQLSYEVLPD